MTPAELNALFVARFLMIAHILNQNQMLMNQITIVVVFLHQPIVRNPADPNRIFISAEAVNWCLQGIFPMPPVQTAHFLANPTIQICMEINNVWTIYLNVNDVPNSPRNAVYAREHVFSLLQVCITFSNHYHVRMVYVSASAYVHAVILPIITNLNLNNVHTDTGCHLGTLNSANYQGTPIPDTFRYEHLFRIRNARLHQLAPEFFQRLIDYLFHNATRGVVPPLQQRPFTPYINAGPRHSLLPSTAPFAMIPPFQYFIPGNPIQIYPDHVDKVSIIVFQPPDVRLANNEVVEMMCKLLHPELVEQAESEGITVKSLFKRIRADENHGEQLREQADSEGITVQSLFKRIRADENHGEQLREQADSEGITVKSLFERIRADENHGEQLREQAELEGIHVQSLLTRNQRSKQVQQLLKSGGDFPSYALLVRFGVYFESTFLHTSTVVIGSGNTINKWKEIDDKLFEVEALHAGGEGFVGQLWCSLLRGVFRRVVGYHHDLFTLARIRSEIIRWYFDIYNV